MVVKISELPAAGSVTDTDEFELNQAGTSRKATLLQVRGAATAPFDDATAVVKGSADATKLLRIEVDSFTTATTRVLTPPNRNWSPTTFGSELSEVATASDGRTKLGLQALATQATVSNAFIDAGAVTANQIYTGSSTSAAAVAGIVDVDFSTLGTSVDFIIVTDVATEHVDLTTPAARRNVYIYNNTSVSSPFDIRDASDVVIVSSVPYRYIARLGWSGTAWVAKSVQAANGHSISTLSGVGALAPLDVVTVPTHFDATGTPDVTTCLRGNNTWGAINPTQVSGGEITAGTETAIRSWSPADVNSFVDQHAAGSVGIYLPIDGTAAGDNVTSITTARAGQTIRVDQNLQLENDVLAGRWWVIKNVHVTNNITLTAEATGQINGASTYVIPKNGGEIVLRCYANAGTAPLCFAEGDSLTVDLGGRQFVDAELIDYSETVSTQTGVTGALTLNFAAAPKHTITHGAGNISGVTVNNWPATGRLGAITVDYVQDGTGGRTVVHPTGTVWANGTPTFDTAAGKKNRVTYTTEDAGTVVVAHYGGAW